MNITVTFTSIHHHPRYWQPDPNVWKPGRWIENPSPKAVTSDNIALTLDYEVLWTPYPGFFLPWAEGERQCPGKKFAQVELVGAVSALLAGGWRIEPVE